MNVERYSYLIQLNSELIGIGVLKPTFVEDIKIADFKDMV